jgi:hypothetical protein
MLAANAVADSSLIRCATRFIKNEPVRRNNVSGFVPAVRIGAFDS